MPNVRITAVRYIFLGVKEFHLMACVGCCYLKC